ncbi:MAG: hypothetical protein JXR64_11645 [Spirochaetales bacterium]|nr:hypothetical protein [Spirochaetales bacterium]
MKIFNILSGQKKSILRDPISILLVFVPFLIFGFIKLGLPIIRPYLLTWIDIYTYYEFILFILYLMIPLLLGMVLGLQLMDERDLDVLSFIAVTPISLRGYIYIKSLTGAVVGFIFNVIIALLVGESFSFRIFIFFIATSLMAPYFAIVIVRFSKNKVEALTKAKLISLIIFSGIVPYFNHSIFTNLLSIFPPFWFEKIFFSNNLSEILIGFASALVITVFPVVFFSKIL